MQGFREWYQGFPSNTANFAITDFRRSVRKSFDITKAGGVHTKAGNESPAGRAPLSFSFADLALRMGISSPAGF